MKVFNHMFDVAFSLNSAQEDASDVTPDMLRAALLRRIEDLDQTIEVHGPSGSMLWLDACGLCDTYEVTDETYEDE